LFLWISICYALSAQNQGFALQLLQKPPGNEAELKQILKQTSTIKDGLLNAYLAKYRYYSDDGISLCGSTYCGPYARFLYIHYSIEAGGIANIMERPFQVNYI
jgi:hypothetical protein